MSAAENAIRERYAALLPVLDEQGRRRFAAAEAQAFGYGGVGLLSRITGFARRTIHRGLEDIAANRYAGPGRVGKPGGGRKTKISRNSALLDDLKKSVEPATLGSCREPLLWTSKSLRQLSHALKELGHDICHTLVGKLLRSLGYSLQANAKRRGGSKHPDRDARFDDLNTRIKVYLASGDAVVSVDTKKKGLVGNFKNNGRDWRPKGSPEEVAVHDFVDPELGRAIPYGIYDIGTNTGWVSVGIEHDTAGFAVHAIRRWWDTMGKERYPSAARLTIAADCGGSNGPRLRLWKVELQKLANELKMPICVCHFPPGTSKWNKIEHRLFSFITQNWRGKPLRSFQAIVQLISTTATQTGLRVRAELDKNKYPKGVAVPEAELAAVNISRHEFHGEWNYTILPSPYS
ncbi:MAG: ISAzo13 family transposase [bacterium]